MRPAFAEATAGEKVGLGPEFRGWRGVKIPRSGLKWLIPEGERVHWYGPWVQVTGVEGQGSAERGRKSASEAPPRQVPDR